MPAMLSLDCRNLRYIEDDSVTVSLEFPTESGCGHRCTRCGEGIVETATGYETESGRESCVSDDEDGHLPERTPLSWANAAAIHSDEANDSITVSISVGDPRGAFTFSVRRVPDDACSDLAGRLVLHVPYPGEPCPHRHLTSLHAGTFVVD